MSQQISMIQITSTYLLQKNNTIEKWAKDKE